MPLSKQKKTVDVVIVAKNEADHIGLCLDSLLAQVSEKVDLELNVIVVDNGSTDATVKIAKTRIENVYCKPGISLAEVRNFGISQGSGEYVAFIDADCSCAPDWLETAIICLDEEHAGAVGGPCILPCNHTLIERAWVAERPCDAKNEVSALATSSFIAKRETFSRVGGFTSGLDAGEDTDISLKIRQQVGPLLSLGKCRVVHYGYPKTIWEFVRREFWHGLWDAKRTRGKSKILLVSYFFVALVCASLLSLLCRFYLWSVFFALFALLIPVALSWKKFFADGGTRLFARENFMRLILYAIYLFSRALAGIVRLWQDRVLLS